MARGRRTRKGDNAEAIVKLVLGGFLLIGFSIGGVAGFASVLKDLVGLVLVGVVALLAIGVAFVVIRHAVRHWNQPPSEFNSGWRPPTSVHVHVPEPASSMAHDLTMSRRPTANTWSITAIGVALEEIDWYQFEKFCAGLLCSEGFDVERRGGAQPDGGVDLIATKGSERILVQCKHWRSWTVQERVVREMLGSMSHFGVNQGVIYTLKGWSKPAAMFAAQHRISLVDRNALARRAATQLSTERMDELLKSRNHHCPKCESVMVWKVGDFKPFWGCPRYPRCRGKLNHSGAR